MRINYSMKVDPGHLAPSQREHSQALTDAANAMERVKQDHGHRLGWKHDPKQ